MDLTGTTTNDKPKLKDSAMGVARAVSTMAPLVPGSMIPCLLGTMITKARHWELMEEVRAKHDMESEPAPFHWTVMAHLERINKLRRAAQREQMQRQLAEHQKQAKIARRRDAFRPNVSRRVLNERNKDSARAQGTTGPVEAGAE